MNVTMVWEGSDDLRALLRPIDELTPHPQNPRRGDVDEIEKSLERFGQVRPILVSHDGVIVAGNHTYAAARDRLGWTHIAANTNEFATAEEARDYLLADNRLADLGEYERAELVVFLEELESVGRWAGTGYVPDDLAHLRSLDKLAEPSPPVEPDGNSGVLAPPAALRDVVLHYAEEKLGEVSAHLRVLRERYELEGVTETVLRAVRNQALRHNQGEGDADDAS